MELNFLRVLEMARNAISVDKRRRAVLYEILAHYDSFSITKDGIVYASGYETVQAKPGEDKQHLRKSMKTQVPYITNREWK
jgi:hypothetical protein